MWSLTPPTSCVYMFRVLLHIGITLIGSRGRRSSQHFISKFCLKSFHQMKRGLIIYTRFNSTQNRCDQPGRLSGYLMNLQSLHNNPRPRPLRPRPSAKYNLKVNYTCNTYMQSLTDERIIIEASSSEEYIVIY